MNREELIDSIAGKSGQTKKIVSDVLKAFVEVVIADIKNGGKVSIVGFGTWSRNLFKARKGRNPQTGAEINIAQKWVPKFSAGKFFKTEVAGK